MKKDDIAKQPWFFAVKGAQRDLIKEAGGVERVAMLLEVSTSLVGTWNSRHEGALMPLWVVMALEEDTNRSIVSRASAGNVGAKVVDAPNGRKAVGCLDTVKAGVMVELSHLTMAFVDADADGHRSPTEIMSIRQEFVDLGNMAASGVSACDSALDSLKAAQ